jgi:hypothetical protein
MEDQIRVHTAALTAVAMTILPGSAFAMATGSLISPNYYAAYAAQLAATRISHVATAEEALSRVANPFVEGTYVNAQIVTTTPDEVYLSAMIRVAHTLASESSDIDADIAKMVDEEFWDLI